MRRTIVGIVVGVMAGVLGLAALAAAGVAGWRGGWIIAVSVFPALVAAATWFGLGRAEHTTSTARGLYATTAAVLALVGGARAIDYAPESRGRLEQRLDGLPLPFYEQQSQSSAGNGWCLPTCPTVTRRYRGPIFNPRSGRVQVAAALATIDLLPNSRLLLAERQNDNIVDYTESIDVRVDLGTDAKGNVTATITLRAVRGFDEDRSKVG